jgi:peptidylprolyl isomerase
MEKAMMRLLAVIAALVLFGCNAATSEDRAATPAAQAAAENMLVMETDRGQVTIELLPQLAPNHVDRIKTLAERGFYDGVAFHRVIDGFMAQTGDPTGTGAGGSDLPDLAAEFSAEPFKRGVIGMARASDPDSANSQFFIMLADGDFLNGQYTVVGKVAEGMEVVDQIRKGDSAANGKVENPDKIIKMRVTGDQ